MRLFCWLAAGGIPIEFDLRRCGWQMADNWRDHTAGDLPLLAHSNGIDAASWVDLLGDARFRRRMVLLGVNDARERARLLQIGFGEVLDEAPSLAELDARTLRVAELAMALPRFRELDRLRLDLFHRDCMVGGRRLGLHPREFALLWRLTDTPGVAVSQAALLSDVWHMFHAPETNRIAVHIFRLRAKLSLAGLGGLIRTAPDGGYYFAPVSPLRLVDPQGEMLDAASELGDEAA